jgi:hypothetical protein
MDVNRIVAELDTEIARLQQIRAALTGITPTSTVTGKPGRGRPKGSKNHAKTATAAKPLAKTAKKAKRKLSPEGRKRIADAMKKRWEERRKNAAK